MNALNIWPIKFWKSYSFSSIRTFFSEFSWRVCSSPDGKSCPAAPALEEWRVCSDHPCMVFHWEASAWSPCVQNSSARLNLSALGNDACAVGVQSRRVTCVKKSGGPVSSKRWAMKGRYTVILIHPLCLKMLIFTSACLESFRVVRWAELIVLRTSWCWCVICLCVSLTFDRVRKRKLTKSHRCVIFLSIWCYLGHVGFLKQLCWRVPTENEDGSHNRWHLYFMIFKHD